MKKKLLNNKAFTLMELIVSIAVTGIFLGMVAMLITSSLNLFDSNRRENSSFSEINLCEDVINKFVKDINESGSLLEYDPVNNVLKSNPELVLLTISTKSIETKNIPNNITNSITIKHTKINIDIASSSLKITYFFKDKLIRTNIFNIIGGIKVC